MTRETKIGIVMVLLMVGVFGFLVYKRVTRPAEELVQTESTSEDETPDEDNPSLTAENEFPPAGRQPAVLQVAGQTRPIPQDEPEDVDDPFGGAESTPPTVVSTRPRLPTSIPDEEPAANETEHDFLAGPTETNSAEPDIDANDPFSGASDAVMENTPQPTASNTLPPATNNSAPTLDFGADEPEESNSFAVEEPVTRTPVRQPVQESFDLAEEETVSVQARAKIPEESFVDDAPEEPEPVNSFTTIPSRAAEPAEPAPQLMLDDSEDDRFGGYQPIELAEAAGNSPFDADTVRGEAPRRVPTSFDAFEDSNKKHPVTIAGGRYVIQNGDNFWSISQKKYGTGKYFQALAAHNQGQIADPNKMKLGIEISLPPAAELERRYPNLMPNSGPKEPSAAVGSPAGAPGEFLVGSDGQPRYRVGAGDTLSGIAQKYLGRTRRWEQILEMNRDVLKDGNSLKLGAVLRLPSDAAPLQLSNQPRFAR